VEARDQVQSPAGAVVPGARARWSNLSREVRAEYLDQHGIGSNQRHRPRRLPRLRFACPLLPFCEEAFLRGNARRRARDKKQSSAEFEHFNLLHTRGMSVSQRLTLLCPSEKHIHHWVETNHCPRSSWGVAGVAPAPAGTLAHFATG